MLKSLHLKNLTVLSKVSFNFGKHLNVIVGENGSGKTHVLKAAYSLVASLSEGRRKSPSPEPTKSYLQTAVASKLRGVFMPDSLGRIASRRPGSTRCEISCTFGKNTRNLTVSLNHRSKTEVAIDKAPQEWLDLEAVYLPTRELLTIYPGFTSLFEERVIPFEETWADTCALLGRPLKRGPKAPHEFLSFQPLEKAMGGSVELDKSGKFYLRTDTGRMEIYLVAEGMRKLATLAYLIGNGTLMGKGYLFWDEPEANLNPRTIKLVAETILWLSHSGIQVFIATHSLFLLRELHIQRKIDPIFSSLDVRYFGLHLQGDHATVDGGPDIEDIGDIAALEEELSQADRYMNSEMGIPVQDETGDRA